MLELVAITKVPEIPSVGWKTAVLVLERLEWWVFNRKEGLKSPGPSKSWVDIFCGGHRRE